MTRGPFSSALPHSSIFLFVSHGPIELQKVWCYCTASNNDSHSSQFFSCYPFHMNITDHHHATTRHRSLQAKILPAICRPTSVPHPPWVPPSFSSHNLQKIKTKSQQASHHIPDLQITAHKCAISVSNFNPKPKTSLPPSLTHSLSVEKSDYDRNGDQQSTSWERILREREQSDIGLHTLLLYSSWWWCNGAVHMIHRERSRLLQVKTLPTLPLRAELRQCSVCDPAKLKLPPRPTRPGPIRSGQARHRQERYYCTAAAAAAESSRRGCCLYVSKG